MTLKKIILTTLSVGALMTSCTDIEDHSVWGFDVSPQMTAYIQGGETNMKTNHFPADAQAGLFLTKVNGSVADATADNRCYNISANGMMTPAKEADELLFPADGSKRDIVAYYPYMKTVQGGELKIEFTAQEKPEVMDVLYSNTAKDKMGLDRQIRLGFCHTMTQLLVVTEKAEGAENAHLDGVTLKNAVAKAKLDLTTGKVKAESAKADVDMVNPATEESKSKEGVRFDAVVAPTGKTTLTLLVKQGDKEATVEVKDVNLQAGKIVVVPLTVNDKEAALTVKAEKTYSGVWVEMPGVVVVTPQKPIVINPDEGESGKEETGKEDAKVESKVIFHETLGEKLVNKKDYNNRYPFLSQYKGFVEKNLKFEDVNKTLSVRSSENKNCIWFKANNGNVGAVTDNDLKISGFSTKDAKKLVLSFYLMAALDDDGAATNLNAMKVVFNGKEVDLPSLEVKNPADKNKWTKITVELPVDVANENSTLDFKLSNSKIGFRLADIELTTEGSVVTPDEGGEGTELEEGGKESGKEEGGEEVNPQPAGVLFVETFGEKVEKVGKNWPSVNDYKGYDNKNLKYSDPFFEKFVKASVRQTSTLNPHVWLAAKGKYPSHTGLQIAGIDTKGAKALELQVDIATNNKEINANEVKLKCNGKAVEMPNLPLKGNEYQTITVEIPAGTTEILFEADNLEDGIRIDNVKLLSK